MRVAQVVLWSVGCAPVTVPPTPSYAVDVAPIIDRHCTRCHTSAGRWDGGVELDGYLAARSTRVSMACTALDARLIDAYADVLVSAASPSSEPCAFWTPTSMPPGATPRLSLVEQATLARWIATGALP